MDDTAQSRVRVDEAAPDGYAQMPPPATAIEEEEVAVAGGIGGNEPRLRQGSEPQFRRYAAMTQTAG